MPRSRKKRTHASPPVTRAIRRRQMTLHECLWRASPEACLRYLDRVGNQLKEAEDYYISRTAKEGDEWRPIDLTEDSDEEDDEEEEIVLDLPRRRAERAAAEHALGKKPPPMTLLSSAPSSIPEPFSPLLLVITAPSRPRSKKKVLLSLKTPVFLNTTLPMDKSTCPTLG